MTDKGRREGREGGVSGTKMHPPGNREMEEGKGESARRKNGRSVV